MNRDVKRAAANRNNAFALCACAFLFLRASPALADTDALGVHRRSMPELSDIALFAFAVFALWFVRFMLRRRFRGGKHGDGGPRD